MPIIRPALDRNMVICNALDYNESPQQGSSTSLWKCKRVSVNHREQDNEFEIDQIVNIAGFLFFNEV